MMRTAPRFSWFRDLDRETVTSVGNRRAEYWTGQRIFVPVSYGQLCEASRKSVATNGNYLPAYRAPGLPGISCAS